MILRLLEAFVLETLRLYVEISPYLLIGFFFAGLLHTLMGEEYIKKHFAVSGLASTVKAAVFGVPLPVCSCGVIPLAESIRRDGASKSATMSFLVSTPSSGVDSILATYALLGPVYAIFRPIASFLSGILVGILTHFQERREPPPSTQDAGKTAAKKKPPRTFKAAMVYGFRVIPSEIAKWLLVGVAVGGAISALVPADFATRYLGSPFLNYVAILLISIPLYVCATGSIPIAASLIAKGIMPGAALAFLIAGPATNTVTISFIYKRMGAKIAAIYIFSIAAVSIATGILFDWVWQTMDLNVGLMTGDGHDHMSRHPLMFLSAILLTIVFITGKFDVSKILSKFKTKGETMAPNTLKIRVPDMTCQHCKMKIDNTLQRIPGITSIYIDLAAREVEVQTELDRQVVLDKIKAEGYNPQ